MSLPATGKGLTITNPLVLYRALLATKRIVPDPAQHRLAIHLQKLYDRLKDYEPTVEYSQRLTQISRAIGSLPEAAAQDGQSTGTLGSRGLWRTLLEQKEKRDSLALTRVMTSHEQAKHLSSPKGLMLHGEVGTGKSMLIDLFADCLPNRKKKRWHFDTFMLHTLAQLERLRKDRLLHRNIADDDHSMLYLARDMITTSPILFLDEFQLPDRAASKIMTNLMTSFFQLGGVLIATSNRMPEELHKAAGVTFSPPPPTRIDSIRWRFGMKSSGAGRSESMFAGNSEFADFLDVLKARCEVWEMGGSNDYRRQEAGTVAPADLEIEDDGWSLDGHDDLQKIPTRMDEAVSQAVKDKADSVISENAVRAPTNYFILPDSALEAAQQEFAQRYAEAESSATQGGHLSWTPATMRVYGRTVPIPRVNGAVTSWTFDELCNTTLGPADYITLASTFHTLILTDVPILTSLKKNEARRFITLLDALYEARCKLIITATAGPDEIFFPETASSPDTSDAVHSETFSEAYQDATAPFRPNILSQNPSYAEEPEYAPSPEPDYTHARLQGMLAPDSLEDDPPNRVRREAGPIDPDEVRPRSSPNFSSTAAFTGEDERFAYKRARSRLWELCSKKWHARDEEGWHKPVPASVRQWERSVEQRTPDPGVGLPRSGGGDVAAGGTADIDEKKDEVLFRHGASPFRTAREPPPKFSWTHVWGTMKWGRKAGAWGQGVEGLKDRKKDK
ncbi:hypothetical protein MBLNU457_3785t1 [Dothideomycetes sp. NU457]